MSKYTTEVRFICENYAGLTESVSADDVDSVIDKSWDKIFTTKAKIFDEAYRSVICKKIVKHFYLREIGMETVGLWKLFMNRKLEEILPYYNKLWESAALEFNPLYDVNYTREGNRSGNDSGNESMSDTTNRSMNGSVSENNNDTRSVTGSGNVENTDNGTRDITDNTTRNTGVNESDNTSSTSSVSGSRNDGRTDLYSDTPQGAITGLEDMNYLTNARVVNGSESSSENTTNTNTGTRESNTIETVENNTEETTTTSGTSENNYTENITDNKAKEVTSENSVEDIRIGTKSNTVNSTEEYLESIKGLRGGKSASLLLQEYRDTFINIDMLVVNEFDELFMGLW